MDRYKYVIGCGMPRSGTHTLAGIVSECDGVNVPHEGSPLGDKNHVLPWEFDQALADARIEEIERNRFSAEFNPNWECWLVGDVAYYYPNYLAYIMQQLPEAKALLIRREPFENIGSLCFRQSRQLRVPWMSEENPWWKKFNETAELPLRRHPWDVCYPKYEEGDPVETAKRYYDEFYDRLVRISEMHYPRRCLFVHVDDINKEDTQKTIFDFLEIPDGKRVYQPELKIDASPWQEIKNLTVWGIPYGRVSTAVSGETNPTGPNAGTDAPDQPGEHEPVAGERTDEKGSTEA